MGAVWTQPAAYTWLTQPPPHTHTASHLVLRQLESHLTAALLWPGLPGGHEQDTERDAPPPAPAPEMGLPPRARRESPSHSPSHWRLVQVPGLPVIRVPGTTLCLSFLLCATGVITALTEGDCDDRMSEIRKRLRTRLALRWHLHTRLSRRRALPFSSGLQKAQGTAATAQSRQPPTPSPPLGAAPCPPDSEMTKARTRALSPPASLGSCSTWPLGGPRTTLLPVSNS